MTKKRQRKKTKSRKPKPAARYAEHAHGERTANTRVVPDSPFALEVRASDVHGKGVFAVEKIAKDSEIIAYAGEVISWEEADARHPHNPDDPNHTFYFALEDDTVIDGAVNGNDARWINHSCEPNCQAVEDDDGVSIHSVRTIRAGEELTFDYALVIDEEITNELKAEYACRCGSIRCRGTMLAVPEAEEEGASDASIAANNVAATMTESAPSGKKKKQKKRDKKHKKQQHKKRKTHT